MSELDSRGRRAKSVLELQKHSRKDLHKVLEAPDMDKYFCPNLLEMCVVPGIVLAEMDYN